MEFSKERQLSILGFLYFKHGSISVSTLASDLDLSTITYGAKTFGKKNAFNFQDVLQILKFAVFML